MADATPQVPGIAPQQVRTAMQSPEQLIRWLHATNRMYLVFDAEDLVRGQAWPHGIEALMAVIAGYRDHRLGAMKGEPLETEELERCIHWLVSQMRERNPKWTLDPA